jgi:hypothetical protein
MEAIAADQRSTWNIRLCQRAQGFTWNDFKEEDYAISRAFVPRGTSPIGSLPRIVEMFHMEQSDLLTAISTAKYCST